MASTAGAAVLVKRNLSRAHQLPGQVLQAIDLMLARLNRHSLQPDVKTLSAYGTHSASDTQDALQQLRMDTLREWQAES